MSFGQRDYDRTKPEIDFPGEAPDDLVIEDITVGEGAEAVEGGFVKVHYLGILVTPSKHISMFF